MKLYLLDADYFDDKDQSVIRLFCKDGKKTVVCLDYGFYPYFLVLPKKGMERELKKKADAIRSVKVRKAELIEKLVSGEKRKLVKVSCFFSTDVPKARDVVKRWEEVDEAYEYSINYYKRYLIDKQIEGWIEVNGKEAKGNYQANKVVKIDKIRPLTKGAMPKLKMMSFDIEVVEDGGKQKITMISMMSDSFEKVLTYKNDRHYGKYVEVLEDEEGLLKRFVEIVKDQDPDILLGYNTDQFDFQILRDRAEEYSKFKLILSRDKTRMKFSRRARVSTARLKGRVHVDLFSFIDTILSPQLQTEVLTLDAVSAELLNDRKISMEYEEMTEAWRKSKDLAKLAEYCLKDSELTLRLGRFMVPQIYELAKISGQLLFDTSRMTYF